MSQVAVVVVVVSPRDANGRARLGGATHAVVLLGVRRPRVRLPEEVGRVVRAILDVQLAVPLAVDPGNLLARRRLRDGAPAVRRRQQVSKRRHPEREGWRPTHETTLRPPPPQPPSLNVSRHESDWSDMDEGGQRCTAARHSRGRKLGTHRGQVDDVHRADRLEVLCPRDEVADVGARLLVPEALARPLELDKRRADGRDLERHAGELVLGRARLPHRPAGPVGVRGDHRRVVRRLLGDEADAVPDELERLAEHRVERLARGPVA